MPCSKILKSNVKPDTRYVSGTVTLFARLAFPPRTWAVLGSAPHGASTVVHRTFVVIPAPQHQRGSAARPLLRLSFRARSAFCAATLPPT